MVRPSDNTGMGGGNEEFSTTQWSQILGVRTSEGETERRLLEGLLRRYWKPVYCYLRRKGHSNDRAKDLTQGFFCDVVLRGSLLQRADQSKGRFRSFLLAALECYLADQHREKTAQCRLPPGALVSLELQDMAELPAATADLNPAETFDYAQATMLLDEALQQVEEQCVRTGKEVHWRLFEEKVLEPIRRGTAGPSFAELCTRYRIRDEHAASNMVITVKRCFHRVLDDLLRQRAGTDSTLEEEYYDLFRHVSGDGAG